jgi:hypothetical protein
MTNDLRKILIRCVTPISWRSRRRLARSLQRFAETEADSAWQMLQALNAIETVESKGKLFNNALEEVRHAEIFSNLARRYSDFPTARPTPQRLRLFDPAKGVTHFEAYHFVGEVEVFEQFLAYAQAAPHADVRETFLQIRGDEEEHQKLAYAELGALAGSEHEARKLIRAVVFSRCWNELVRFGEAVGHGVANMLFSLVYWLAAPFFFASCRRRLNAVSRAPGV